MDISVLRKFRKELGVKQEPLARAAGVGRCSLVLAESGKRNISDEDLQALAEALLSFAAEREQAIKKLRLEMA